MYIWSDLGKAELNFHGRNWRRDWMQNRGGPAEDRSVWRSVAAFVSLDTALT